MAFCRDRTVMKLYDFTGDGKAETGTSVSRSTGAVQTEELFEDSFQFFWRNCRAFILYGQDQCIVFLGQADLYDSV